MRAALVLVVFLLVGAACGDSGGADVGATPPTTTGVSDTVDVAEEDEVAEITQPPSSADDDEDQSSTTVPATVPASTEPASVADDYPTTTVPPATTSPDSTPPTLTDLAIADLAARLGVDPSSINVVFAQEVTWRNGSLGCPEPGMSYTQALVEGFRIILAFDGVEYAYHSGRGQEPFFCATPAKDGSLSGS